MERLGLVLSCIAIQICIGLTVGLEPGQKDYRGHQIFKVFLRSRRDLDVLDELRKHIKVELVKEPTEHAQPVEVLVSPGQRELVKIFLKSRGLEFKVTIEDLQDILDDQINKATNNLDQGPENFNFGEFHTLDQIYSWMQYMAEQFPNLVTLTEIGKSFEQRSMYLLQVRGEDYGMEKAGIWLDSGIHSNEWVAPSTLIYFINQLVRGYGVDRELSWMVDSLDWYFLPVFNPDGYVYTWTKDRLWRKNRAVHPPSAATQETNAAAQETNAAAHGTNTAAQPPSAAAQETNAAGNVSAHQCVGVDLNRNWDSHWAETNAETDPCSRMYVGPAPFSEPETQAVSQYLANHNDSIKAYLAYHSFSQLWMLPYSYSKEKTPSNLEQLTIIGTQAVRALKQVHGTQYTVGRISELVGEASGASVDYTYGALGIEYSFGVELRDLGEWGTRLPANQIIPNAQESLEALKVVGFFLIDKMVGDDDYWTG